MPRSELGVHRHLRSETYGALLLFAVGLGLIAFAAHALLVGAGAATTRFVVVLVVGIAASTAGGWTLGARLALLRNVSACAHGADLVSLEVVSAGEETLRAVRTSLCLCADVENAEPFDWSVFPWHGEPLPLSARPRRIAGLRARMAPRPCVPFLSTGYPFAMSRATRDELLGADAPVDVAADAIRWRPELPIGAAPDTPVGRRNRTALVGLLVLLLVLGLGVVLLPGDWKLLCALPGALGSVVWFALLPRTAASFGTLTLTDAGIELRSFLGRRRVPWDDVACIEVRSFDLHAQRIRLIGGALGMAAHALGPLLHAATSYAEQGVAEIHRRRMEQIDADGVAGDEISRRLDAAGALRPHTVPLVRVRRTDRSIALRLPGCHGWRAVRALGAAAALRGARLDAG